VDGRDKPGHDGGQGERLRLIIFGLEERQEQAMTYRVYSGPKGSEDVTPFTKSSMLFKEFGTIDEALLWARHIEETGRVPLLLEGDDGTRMNRRELNNALRVGAREQIGR
jgi:hypothetical protein